MKELQVFCERYSSALYSGTLGSVGTEGPVNTAVCDVTGDKERSLLRMVSKMQRTSDTLTTVPRSGAFYLPAVGRV